MKKLVFPISQAKKAITLILNSNKLKSEVKLLYPNKMFISDKDLPVATDILRRNHLNYNY